MISGIAHLFTMLEGGVINKGLTPARFLMVFKMNEFFVTDVWQCFLLEGRFSFCALLGSSSS